MALPSNVNFGTVTGRFMRAVADGLDADRDPDGEPIVGLQIMFQADLNGSAVVRNATAAPSPVTILIDPVYATTDSDGYLIGVDRERSIRLVATDDPDLDPHGWTYRVTLSSPSYPRLQFSFALPMDSTIDLTSVVPVPPSPGEGLIAWQLAVEETLANKAAAEVAASEAVEAATSAAEIAAGLENAVSIQLDEALAFYPSMVTAGENFAAKVDLLADNMAVGLAGDSTGDENAEWFRRGHELWLPSHPALACDYTRWDITTETNSPAIALQTSSGSVVVAAEDSFSRTAADLIGSGSPEAGNSWSGETGKFSVDGSAAVVTAAPGNVQAVGTVQGGDRLSTWSVTVDTNSKAVGGVLNLHAGASAGNRVWVYVSIAASGAVTWGVQKQIGGVFANVVNGTGTPLAASAVQTVPVTLRLNGTTVTASLNGVSVTATLSAGDVAALATAANTYITTTGAGAIGWKIESVKVVVTVAPKKLTIYNASKAGSTLDYQAAHTAAMFPAPLDLLFISSCHNYGSDSAQVYLTKVLAFIDAFRAIHPETGIVVVAQNPEFPPNATHEAHRKRLASLRGFAKRHNFGYLPAAEAFQKRPDGGVAAVRVDGVHPKAAFELADPNNGSYIWAAVLRDWYTKLSLLT